MLPSEVWSTLRSGNSISGNQQIDYRAASVLVKELNTRLSYSQVGIYKLGLDCIFLDIAMGPPMDWHQATLEVAYMLNEMDKEVSAATN